MSLMKFVGTLPSYDASSPQKKEKETTDNQDVSPPRAAFIPKGFILSIRCPTEERLNVRVDITDKKNHLEFVHAIQDTVDEINIRLSSSKVKPRVCAVKYRKERAPDGSFVRRKILEISPYPSCLINRLKAVRTNLYAAIRKHTVRIFDDSPIYFLPTGEAPALVEEVKAINGTLAALRADVRAFEQSEDAKKIITLLSSARPANDNNTGAEEPQLGLQATIDDATVTPIPFSLSREFFAEFIDEAKLELEKLNLKKSEMMDKMQQEVEAERKRLLEAMEKSLKERLCQVLDQLEAASKSARPSACANKELKEAVESAANLAESFGLEIAPALRDAADSIEKQRPAAVAGRLLVSLGSSSFAAVKRKIAGDPLLDVA